MGKIIQDFQWCFEENKCMADVKSRATSEMTLDIRTDVERDAAKYNVDLTSLNTEYKLFKSVPQLIAR